MEKWRAIPNYTGRYEVSDKGRVRNRDHLVMKQRKQSAGYLCVNLFDGYAFTTFLTHRLVYATFVGHIPIGFVVNHKNGNKRDNCVTNLEVLTQSDNVKHAHATGLIPASGAHGSRNGRAKLSERDVVNIRKLREKLTVKALADKFGVSISTVERVIYKTGWLTVI